MPCLKNGEKGSDEVQQKMSLVLPYEFEIVFKSLPLAEAGRLILAIYAYEQRNILPDFSDNPMLKFAWDTHIKPKIDENIEKYNAICEARRTSGSKGGKANQEKQKEANQANATFANQNKQKVANQADYDCDCDCDGDKEKIHKKESGFSPDEMKIAKLWEERFGTVSSYRMTNIQDLVSEFGVEIAEYAVKEAHQAGNSAWQYIKAIARNERMRRQNGNTSVGGQAVETKSTVGAFEEAIRKAEERRKTGTVGKVQVGGSVPKQDIRTPGTEGKPSVRVVQ